MGPFKRFLHFTWSEEHFQLQDGVCVCVCVCVHVLRMLAYMHVQATQSYSLSQPSAVGRLPMVPVPPCPPPSQTLPAHGGPLAALGD